MTDEATLATQRRLSTVREAMLTLRLGNVITHALPGGSSVIALRAAGDHPGIFVLPGGRGGVVEVASYAALLASIDGVPIHGLLFPGHDGQCAVPESVRAIASKHIEAVKQIQPHGPYRLVGECVGGGIALEMARLLSAMGECVERIILLDTWRPTALSHWRYRLFGVPRLVKKDVCARLKDAARERGRKVESAASSLRRICRFALHAPGMFSATAIAALGDHLARPGRRWPRAAAYVSAGNAYLDAGMRYRPEPYHGPVSLLVTDEYRRKGLLKEWQSHGLCSWDVRVLPGDHASYLGSSAELTGAVLAECLGAPHSGVAMASKIGGSHEA